MNRQVGFAALAALGALIFTTLAAAAGPEAKLAPVKLEPISGSGVKRITLSQKAAERLGIELGKVAEDTVTRKQMVGGLVTRAPETPLDPKFAGRSGFSGFAPTAFARPAEPSDALPVKSPAAPGEAWLLVTLSPGEWERLAKDKPARLHALGTREKLPREVLAMPSGAAPVEDAKRSMVTVQYVVQGTDHGLAPNKRMRVELQLAGAEQKQKVVPYSAVYYDARGAAWLYVTPQPLTFERRPVTIDRVTGDSAILSDGPPVGTSVVTVGAALHYGTEIFGK